MLNINGNAFYLSFDLNKQYGRFKYFDVFECACGKLIEYPFDAYVMVILKIITFSDHVQESNYFLFILL